MNFSAFCQGFPDCHLVPLSPLDCSFLMGGANHTVGYLDPALIVFDWKYKPGQPSCQDSFAKYGENAENCFYYDFTDGFCKTSFPKPTPSAEFLLLAIIGEPSPVSVSPIDGYKFVAHVNETHPNVLTLESICSSYPPSFLDQSGTKWTRVDDNKTYKTSTIFPLLESVNSSTNLMVYDIGGPDSACHGETRCLSPLKYIAYKTILPVSTYVVTSMCLSLFFGFLILVLF